MSNIPTHIAIIPDGNRRWAKEKGLPTFEGHRKGFDQVIKLGKKSRELGIKVLTLWAFSTENWKRSTEEVNYLMKLYEVMIDKSLKEALKEKIMIIHIGRKDRLNKSLFNKITKAEAETKNFDKYYLVIALDYGGKDEIIRAIKKVQSSKFNSSTSPAFGVASLRTSVQSLEEKDFGNFLDTKELSYPNVDLVIRTSGEERTSGFMLWQAAYAEYIFVKKYFPDFTAEDLESCVKEYQKRQRRFGG